MSILRGLACAVAIGLATVWAAPAFSQNITSELERLRRELSDLQRYVYSGGTAPTPGVAVSSGSEELSGDVAARLQVQIQNLERRMQETTGLVEETNFRIRQIEQRLETALGDIEFRLNALEGGAPATASTGVQPLGQDSSVGSAQQIIPVTGSTSGTTVISSEGATQQTGQGTTTTGNLSGGSLGSLIVDSDGNVVGSTVSEDATQGSGQQPATTTTVVDTTPQAAPTVGSVEGADLDQAGGSTQSAALPEGAQELYDHSLGLMRQAEYAEAEASLRVFLDQHSDHELVGAALYWLGETHYVRQDYREAAFAFVDVYSKYPDSNKAPDSLLKLGMSLQALGSSAEACTAFATLQSDYPDARRAVIRLAEDRAADYGC